MSFDNERKQDVYSLIQSDWLSSLIYIEWDMTRDDDEP
jgi:hypothetical protein